MAETLDQLYEEMIGCSSCRLRKACTQVVLATGNKINPILMAIGDGPGQDEDEQGEPFIGMAGQALRTVFRNTGIINRTNTIITNVVKCRPPKNKFPKDDCPEICVSRWLWEEIRLAKPKRILLLGATPLQYVADLEGIGKCRGQWFTVRGIRTMPTYHPSYILRQDMAGMMVYRDQWVSDINEMAKEVEIELKKENEGKSPEVEQKENVETELKSE